MIDEDIQIDSYWESLIVMSNVTVITLAKTANEG